MFAVFLRKKKPAQISADGGLQRQFARAFVFLDQPHAMSQIGCVLCLRNAEISQDSLSNVIPKALETVEKPIKL